MLYEIYETVEEYVKWNIYSIMAFFLAEIIICILNRQLSILSFR